MLKIAVLTVVGMVTGGLFLLWLTGERWWLMRPSTRELMKAQGWKNMLNFKSLHSYIYMRWQKAYMKATRWLVRHSDDGTRKRIVDGYHAKVVTHDQARAIITLNRSLPLRDLEQVIPYHTARDLLLTGPQDVVATECRCRASLEHHCEPTQVCMMMGKPFTDFFLEHRPEVTRRLSQDEALDLLKRTHELGLIHTAWFKDVMLNRMFSICNCCRCCCGGTAAMMKFGMPLLASSGYVSRIDDSRCDACGTCQKSCHFEAITVDKAAAVTWEKCMGCGVCEAKCPNGAVSLVRDERKGIPFDVRVMV